MHLTKSDILAILNWMKTKPYFRDRLRMFGPKETLLSYLKGKSEKQLMFILFALKTKSKNSLRKYPTKNNTPKIQIVSRVIDPQWKRISKSYAN